MAGRKSVTEAVASGRGGGRRAWEGGLVGQHTPPTHPWVHDHSFFGRKATGGLAGAQQELLSKNQPHPN